MAKILVIDDEALVRAMVREAAKNLGYEVDEATTLQQGIALAMRGCELILLDVMLPDGDGLAHLDVFAALPQKPEMLVITGFGHADGAASALHSGAMEYLVKPLQMRDLQQAIAQALAWREQKQLSSRHMERQEIIGNSRTLNDTLAQLGEAAASEVNVLILGETGVGKELFARALHHNSPRRSKSCVTVDCAALPENLLESQLFGHAKGAFTGAERSHEGLLRVAHEGTLFLDEVGELPLSLQASFLRALDVHRFRPVGEKDEVSSDFRLVCATNRNLEEMVQSQGFRGDLLFRLQGMVLTIPPLRRRKEDIPLLVRHFLSQAKATHKEISPSLMDALMSYNWPGNIRELNHVIQRTCIMAGSAESLCPHHLPTNIRVALSAQKLRSVPCPDNTCPPPPEPDITLKEHKYQAEAQYLDQLLKFCENDMSRAAKMAGVSRGHLYELLKKHDLGN